MDKTIFVLSQIDDVADDNDILKVENKITSQILDTFNIKPTIIKVSAKLYIQGKKENFKPMINKSNIENLKILIDSMKNEKIDDIKKSRRQKFLNFINKIKSDVLKDIEDIQEEERKIIQENSELNKEIETIETTLINSFQRLNSLSKTAKNGFFGSFNELFK